MSYRVGQKKNVPKICLHITKILRKILQKFFLHILIIPITVLETIN